MNKNKIIGIAANEFAEKIRKLSGILEISVVGSVAGGDPHPNDLDIVVIIRNLDEPPIMAKCARQMSSHYHNWDVFFFDEDISPLGRICRRRECPTQSVDCCVSGCGKPPHLQVCPDFEYDENKFLASPIKVLWTSFKKKDCLLARKDELSIESRKYPVLEDIEIKCRVCGNTFVFTGGEQKQYQKLGFCQPKRCLECREQKYMEE
ncbi:MAG: hypothetical protein MSIBF_04635 [Candidatus Altiarchaeales archaeon IMC4]|nr:MAG: hypothetical protein MSIBF_04635 [Candidatus Altiarchaeales archaeon IMC4]